MGMELSLLAAPQEIILLAARREMESWKKSDRMGESPNVKIQRTVTAITGNGLGSGKKENGKGREGRERGEDTGDQCQSAENGAG